MGPCQVATGNNYHPSEDVNGPNGALWPPPPLFPSPFSHVPSCPLRLSASSHCLRAESRLIYGSVHVRPHVGLPPGSTREPLNESLLEARRALLWHRGHAGHKPSGLETSPGALQVPHLSSGLTLSVSSGGGRPSWRSPSIMSTLGVITEPKRLVLWLAKCHHSR